MLPCVSICQITVQINDSLTISAEQVKNIYTGLKTAEVTEQRLNECEKVANELNSIIQEQNESLQLSGLELSRLNIELSEQNDLLLKSAVHIQKLKDKKTPWYRHPVTWSIIGLIGGILIAK